MPVQYGGDKITFSDGSTVGNGWSGAKNKIINGDMRVAQRGTVTSAGIDTYGGCDRWKVWCADGGETGRVTMSQSTDAPSGFRNSQQLTVTTAQTSVSSSHAFDLVQRIESINCDDMGFGTSGKYMAVSFWAKSSKAGTYAVNIYYVGASTSKVNVREVSLTSTWTYYTLSFSVDSAQALSSSGYVQLGFGLMAGSGWQGGVTTDTWATHGGNWYTSNQANFFDTVGNTINITGVQLEKGSTATSFDYRPYGTELSLCQRYFYSLGGTAYEVFGFGSWRNSTTASIYIKHSVPMRVQPTLNVLNLANTWLVASGINTPTSANIDQNDLNATMIDLGGVTASYSDFARWLSGNSTFTRIQLSSEL
jgi:hypothetical protein